MSRVHRGVLLLGLAACGPKVGDASDMVGMTVTSSGSAATTSSATTSSTSTTIDPDPTTSSESSGNASSSSADSSTGEICVSGTFVGLVSGGFESSAFLSCETGEYAWFPTPANESCPGPLWVRVEGELCGPGSYGHLGGADYELRGDIVEGPCEADCAGEPEPETCSSFPVLCPLIECLIVGSDCPAGDRCVPTVIEMGPPWYGATCVPAPANPHAIGESCTSDGPWQDNCEPGAYCVAGKDGTGICAEACWPNDEDACGADTCWPCDFVDEPAFVGVCGATEVAC